MTTAITNTNLLPAVVRHLDTAARTPSVPQKADPPRRLGYENTPSANVPSIDNKLGFNGRGGFVDVYV